MKHRLCWPFTPRVRLSHFYGRFHSCQLHFQTALIFTHFPPKKLLYVYVVQFCIMPTNLSIHYIFWKMYLTFAIARCKKDMGCALKISCLHKCKCCKQNLDLMLYLVPALRAIVLLQSNRLQEGLSYACSFLSFFLLPKTYFWPIHFYQIRNGTK